jgi:hypothetical protein
MRSCSAQCDGAARLRVASAGCGGRARGAPAPSAQRDACAAAASALPLRLPDSAAACRERACGAAGRARRRRSCRPAAATQHDDAATSLTPEALRAALAAANAAAATAKAAADAARAAAIAADDAAERAADVLARMQGIRGPPQEPLPQVPLPPRADDEPEPSRRLPRRIFIIRHGESQARACRVRCARTRAVPLGSGSPRALPRRAPAAGQRGRVDVLPRAGPGDCADAAGAPAGALRCAALLR